MDLPSAEPGEINRIAGVGLLSRHLLAHATATEALAVWCEEYGIGDGPIRTEVLHRAVSRMGERSIGYRRVRLLRGAAFLSSAEIRYRCDVLSPAMLRALGETTAPFGTVVAALGPHRVTTLARFLAGGPGQSVLIHHATVRDRCGRAIARVREAYQGILTA